MLELSLSDYLDLDSSMIYKQELKEAFDLLELGRFICSRGCFNNKEEYIDRLMVDKYNDEYSVAREAAYEEFKTHGFKG